jgi:hypothetical protein
MLKRRTTMVKFRDSIVRTAGSSGVGSWLRRISVDAGVFPGADHREMASLARCSGRTTANELVKRPGKPAGHRRANSVENLPELGF